MYTVVKTMIHIVRLMPVQADACDFRARVGLEGTA